MRLLSCVAAAIGLACLTLQAAESFHHSVQFLFAPTADQTYLTLVAPVPGQGITAGGLAVDRRGNIYVSDQGDRGPGSGSIIMFPKGRSGMRIIRGLTRPGDIELSKDQRVLFVSEPGSVVRRIPLGISVRVLNRSTLTPRAVLHVQSDTGRQVVEPSPDGYFHVAGLLEDTQTSLTINLSYEQAGQQTEFLDRSLLQPGASTPYGQIVIDLLVP